MTVQEEQKRTSSEREEKKRRKASTSALELTRGLELRRLGIDLISQVKADAEATELQGDGRACAETHPERKSLHEAPVSIRLARRQLSTPSQSHHRRSACSFALDFPPHELLPELPRGSEKIVPATENPKVFLATRPSFPDGINVVDLKPSSGRASHTARSPELTLIARTIQKMLAH